jgi:hypothetical protein
MARKRGEGLSAAEAARLLEGYERSQLTRRAYCEQVGISVSTLDYYRRRLAAGERAGKPGASLVPVRVIPPGRGFVLVLNNGRRIESGWDFASEELARLVRVAEQG